jgi:hypothetical protein
MDPVLQGKYGFLFPVSHLITEQLLAPVTASESEKRNPYFPFPSPHWLRPQAALRNLRNLWMVPIRFLFLSLELARGAEFVHERVVLGPVEGEADFLAALGGEDHGIGQFQ